MRFTFVDLSDAFQSDLARARTGFFIEPAKSPVRMTRPVVGEGLSRGALFWRSGCGMQRYHPLLNVVAMLKPELMRVRR